MRLSVPSTRVSFVGPAVALGPDALGHGGEVAVVAANGAGDALRRLGRPRALAVGCTASISL